ncbi:hypothetical protein TVAG_445380 [Trichomonas vaginalis G3]|uniref:Uncharacterized protein n=1 Tax=Trichomonas vaginalis (strain ATCC PRA-98 / G3) TaxID=412133 RepID=A2E4K4_TRIV3|nr:histone-lysine N-methyltransferase family [Trichomonas vaginalis G3]EAY12426.1 hypothetical protein TVAG_445380 [Trichomonas vaginalis G3]KAI5494191.1 histone-lysine N-methyltransferase family [Trichomonas vaginalis G3]|eukprot:XP_001324649.1 hypothetical protein [Trichomonas vaginalis G3]
MESIQLDLQVFQRINNCQTSDKFTLTINNFEIILNKFFAITFSLMIHKKYLLDNSINKVDISLDIETSDTYNVLKNILQCCETSFKCDKKILKDLFHIGVELEIKELVDIYKKKEIDHMTLNKNNCIQFLEYYIYCSYNEKISECCEYISSHFYEIDLNQLKAISTKLGIDIIQRIVINKKFLIKDENSFANFIISLTQKSKNFSPLIEHINFEYCSDHIIKNLYEICDGDNCVNIIKSLGESLLRSRYHIRDFSRYHLPTEYLEKMTDLKKSYSKLIESQEKFNIKKGLKSFENLPEGLTQLMIPIINEYYINGYLMLMNACYDGRLDHVKLLVESGCYKDVVIKSETLDEFNNSYDEQNDYDSDDGNEYNDSDESDGYDEYSEFTYGCTPLYVASVAGKLDIVKYLISIGVDKDSKVKHGRTPIMAASDKGNLDVVKYLYSVGANINAKDNDGRTPIMAASDKGNLDVVKYLYSVGANINAKDNDGRTPIMAASNSDRLDVVKYLISVGANKDAKDNEGKNALDYAGYDVEEFLSSN